MKSKLFIVLVAMCFTSFSAHAESEQQDSLYVVNFGFTYTDPTIGHDGNGKSPVVPPSVSIDGHTLYLYSGCAGATLQVVNDLDEVAYTTEIPDFIEEIELPETLVGEYELQILRGNFCFYATIEL